MGAFFGGSSISGSDPRVFNATQPASFEPPAFLPFGKTEKTVMEGDDERVYTRPRIGQCLLKNMDNVFTRHFKAQFDAAQTNFASTFGVITKAPCLEFTHVRVLLANGEATPPSVTGVLIAVTNSNADRTVPSTGNTVTGDGSTGWVQVTFDGSDTPTLVAGTSSNPALLFSDWMAIDSIAPTDSGSIYPYIMARIKLGANFSAQFIGTSNNTNTQDTYCETRSKSGDFVTTPASMTESNSAAGSYSPIFGFEFMSSSRCVRVLCVGSSTTQGFGSTPVDSAFRGWAPIAQETLLTQGIPINIFNYGFSGQSSATYRASGKAAIAAHQPSILLYQTYTPNDGTITQAIANAQFAGAMDIGNYALSQGCLPVLVFTNPNNNLDATADAFRKSLITRCKESGFEVLDMTPSVGDGALPERYTVGMNYDVLHPNDTGYTAMGAIAAAKLKEIIKRNFAA